MLKPLPSRRFRFPESESSRVFGEGDYSHWLNPTVANLRDAVVSDDSVIVYSG
jgi:hypothetical protein